jgi:DNA-directed RNA polymerase specialized sigma24 family protein
LRPWLFRIAHNRALDYLRRYERRMSEPLDTASDLAADKALEPDSAVARNEAVHAAISQFQELAPVQRSCVVLKDVFDYSLDEIAAMLEPSVSAIKSALVRGARSCVTCPRPPKACRSASRGRVLYHQCSRAMRRCSIIATGISSWGAGAQTGGVAISLHSRPTDQH